MSVLLGLLVSLLFVGAFVQLAKRFGWGKAVRRDGPRSHLRKEGTPTMGGAAFLPAAFVAWLVAGETSTDGWVVVALVTAAALLGWYDDYASLQRKRRISAGGEGVANEDASTGLLARYRLLLQALFALLFSLYAVLTGHPLFGIAPLDVLAYAFIITGTINAVNFSDGLDGLAGGMVALMLLPFLSFSLAASFVGALLGFLWYNAQPARVFMGGVGSEALGAGLAGVVILAGWTWWLPLIALVPLLEVVSVMLQVSYFRLTNGKRLFRMSPLHHHFELSGWTETQVVTRFWLVTAACVALAWSLNGGRV